MKFRIQLIALLLLSFVSYSQNDPYLKDNVFYTTFESGVGIETKVSFSINQETLEKIDSFEVFKEFEKVTLNNPANEKYLKRWSKLSHKEMFLNGKTGSASFMAKLKLKNGTSYTPIENSKGRIFFMSDNQKLVISFPFKAQNGRGEMLISNCYYSISWDGSKEVVETLISE